MLRKSSLKSWRTLTRYIFILPLLVLCFHWLSVKRPTKDHYPTLLGAYCFTDRNSSDYVEPDNIDDAFYIQQCSWRNIDACQHIHNQTLLFRAYDGLGFASELNQILRMFSYAIHNRRRFLIDGQEWNYGPFASFFNLSRGHFSPWLSLSARCLQRNFVHVKHYRSQNMSQPPEHLTIARDVDGWTFEINAVAQPLEKSNQTFHMRRAVTDYLWQTLNDETRHFIDRQLNAIRVDQISYAMHIRRGDKALEAPLLSAKKYIDEVEHFMKNDAQTNLTPRIYVASDAPDAISELQQLRPRWEFIQLDQKVLQSGGHQQTSFNQLPVHLKIDLTRIFITEIEILSRVKYVVCTFSSNVCRLVQTLRKQNPATIRSLDIAWHAE